MCYGCSLWFPLNPTGCRLLGLDPTLPLWIHIDAQIDLYCVMRHATGLQPLDDGSLNAHTWLNSHAEANRNTHEKRRIDHTVTYTEIMQNHVPLPGEDPENPHTLHHMILNVWAATDLNIAMPQLVNHSLIWHKPMLDGRGNQAGSEWVKTGRLSISRSRFHVQYHNDPLLLKYFDLID